MASSFWGQVFAAGSSTAIETPEGMDLCVTSLALNAKDGQKAQLFLEVEGLEEEKILLATLRAGKTDQTQCQVRISSDQPVLFTVEGSGEIHASGFLQPDDDEDMYDEDGNSYRSLLYPSDSDEGEEEEEEEEEEPVAKKPAAAKPAAGNPKKAEPKEVAKPAPKKEAAKPVEKKAETKEAAKPAPKKAEAKEAPKPASKKEEAAKPAAKKAETKEAKPAAKKEEASKPKETKAASEEGSKKRKGEEHPKAPETKKAEGEFKCAPCNKSFKGESGLRDHNTTKHK